MVVVVVHNFNPSTLGRGRRQRQEISEFSASLVYRVSSRAVRATQRNPGGRVERVGREGGREKER